MNSIRKITVVLFFFVGVGACAGGLTGVLDPISPMGIPVEVLKNSPFTDFFIPCLFLLLVLGVGNLISAVWTIKKAPLYDYCSGFMGVILCTWIFIQCVMLRDVVALHIISFTVGIIQCICCLFVLLKKDLFPVNWIKKWIQKKNNNF